MITKKEFFEEIYYINQPKYLSNKQWDNLLLSGEINWDKYFTPFKTKQNHDVIKNMELVWFDTEDAMFKYIKKLSPFLLENYSLEHESPCVLKLV